MKIKSWVCGILASLATLAVAETVTEFVLNTVYDGPSVVCTKEVDVKPYVDLLKKADSDAIQKFLSNPDTSCYAGYTRFKMTKIVSSQKVQDRTLTVTEGYVLGGYLPLLGYVPFEKPETSYFFVGIPVVKQKGVTIPRGKMI